MASQEDRRIRATVSVLVGLLVLGIGLWLMLYAPSGIRDQQYKDIARSLGAFFTASVVVSFLYNITIRPFDDSKMEKRLSTLMQKEFQRISENDDYGLVGIRGKLDWNKLLSNIPNGYTLWWLDTYDPGYKLWLDSLEGAIKRGVTFKMLIMDPDSTMLEHRARELGAHYKSEVFRKELIGFLDEMKCVKEKYPDKMEIVKYQGLPSAPIYILSREKRCLFGENVQTPFRAYSSYFLSMPTGVSFPHLIWKQGETAFLDELFKYVVEKWGRNILEREA